MNKVEEMDESREELIRERYELVCERVRAITKEETVKEPYRDYFVKTASFILQMIDLHKKTKNGWLKTAAIEELEQNNQRMYADILPENYEKSYGNPDTAARLLGKEMGAYLSFLYAEIRGMIVFAYEDRLEEMTVAMELFTQIYNLFEDEYVTVKEVKDAIYWYVSDYCEDMVERRVQDAVDSSLSFAVDIIMKEDLSDNRYLYYFGEYVTKEELAMAEFLNTLPKEGIEAMARTFTEGYRIGFEVTKKDISKKKSVNIRYELGFERMIREAIRQFREIGLEPIIYRSAVHAINKRQHHRIGYYGAIPNQQYDYDHKGDSALYLDSDLMHKNFVPCSRHMKK